jgi:hypothetical protein
VTLRRGAIAYLVVLAAFVLLALVPWPAGPLALSDGCRGVLVEAPPEHVAGDAWFNYAPNAGIAFSPGVGQAVCGSEARQRLVLPLLVLLAGGAAVAVAAVRRPRARTLSL